jgi:hypothetical protein
LTDPLGLRGIIPWGQYYWSWGKSSGEYDPDIISDLGNEDDERARGAIHKIELNFEGRPGGPPATILFLLGWLGPCAGVPDSQAPYLNYRAYLDYPGDMISYRSQPIFPDRDYNRYDWLISGWVDYWNWRARKEGKPYHLDPNFFKAIAYKETTIGYNLPGGDTDYQGIVQLGTDAIQGLMGGGAGKVTWGPINVVDKHNPSHNIGGGVRWLILKL